ncbi:hypothetical protein ACGFY3_43600 [Streptomyces mirabilis]|uniref:hypothetical protein n=1 Tax=Streptomyces mirabilis TaxID=68239 RepID=UPI003721F4A4
MGSSKPSDERLEWWPTVPLEGVACTTLWWWRGHPRTVVAVTTAGVNNGTVAGCPITPMLLGPVTIALHWPAIRTGRATARIGLFGVPALMVPTAVLADTTSSALRELKTTVGLLRQANILYHPLTPQQRSRPYLIRWLLGPLVAGGPAAVPLWSVSVTPDA